MKKIYLKKKSERIRITLLKKQCEEKNMEPTKQKQKNHCRLRIYKINQEQNLP